jgi:hypothetical protein
VAGTKRKEVSASARRRRCSMQKRPLGVEGERIVAEAPADNNSEGPCL